MKRFLSLLLALLLIFSFAACQKSEPAPTEPVSQSSAVSSALSEAAPPQKQTEPPKAQAPPKEEVSSSAEPEKEPVSEEPIVEEPALDEDGSYTTKEDVALYIHLYKKLPSNFITKKQAEKLGWSGGGLEPYAPGKCIGGNRFGNYEGLLPKAEGRSYTECDIDTLGAKSRGAKRIVFSNDGLIYYTDDHYKSFELLYGEEN